MLPENGNWLTRDVKYRLEECPECDGWGIIEVDSDGLKLSKPIECTNCNGRGKVRVEC